MDSIADVVGVSVVVLMISAGYLVAREAWRSLARDPRTGSMPRLPDR